MQRKTRTPIKKPSAPGSRTILYVDPDPAYAATLHDAWVQLRLEDKLHIVSSQQEALAFLESAQDKNITDSMAAVILDPDATGEETGAFLREVRKHCGTDTVPIVFWSRDGDKYGVLEGKGVKSVLKKPMVLRLIKSLDVVCKLRVQPFRPFPGTPQSQISPPRSIAGIGE